MSDSQEEDVMGTSATLSKPNIPVDSANLNKTDTSKGFDNQNNLDLKIDFKHYDSKLSLLTLPPNLNIDPQNYMLRVGRPRECGTSGRPRSLSFSDGTVTSDSNNTKKNQLSSRQQSVSTNPLDLDMFCVRETVNSLSNLDSPEVVVVPYSTEVLEEMNQLTPATLGCARTLSFHSFLCTCQLSCCCMCDSLFPPDCNACLLGICVHLTTTHLCQRTVDIFPSVTPLKDQLGGCGYGVYNVVCMDWQKRLHAW